MPGKQGNKDTMWNPRQPLLRNLQLFATRSSGHQRQRAELVRLHTRRDKVVELLDCRSCCRLPRRAACAHVQMSCRHPAQERGYGMLPVSFTWLFVFPLLSSSCSSSPFLLRLVPAFRVSFIVRDLQLLVCLPPGCLEAQAGIARSSKHLVTHENLDAACWQHLQ